VHQTLLRLSASSSDKNVNWNAGVATVTQLPRIGLIAVRADRQRRGIARALLAHTLGALHQVGKETVSAQVTESNVAATALFERIGARRTGSNLELVLR
jgi:ribosomal protein S18 acetylase RimI-like enzyme